MSASHKSAVTMTATPAPDFPAELVGRRVLLATESLGPVNGVSRTTQSLVDYLRKNGVNVATCAPVYKGQSLCATEPKERNSKVIVNPDWLRAIEARSSALGSRAIGGAWLWHSERTDAQDQSSNQESLHRRPRILARSREESVKRKFDSIRRGDQNPEFRLQGTPLPYNPDLTVAYPFRLGRVYSQTFEPEVIYLASPASVGFQFLVQLAQMDKSPPVLLNFQTDLAAYSTILFAPPLDRYAAFLLQKVQGFLFCIPAVRTIFYPSAYVRKYMEDAGAPSNKMIQLGRGVDTELFNPRRRDESYRKELAPNGEIVLCCISRLAPEKGFEFLARVAELLYTSGLPFKLLIVGGNKNPTVERDIRDSFRSLGSNVIFTGFLRGPALARAYASADVFLHCSITETFGLVVLESMASGVPVIARDEGGPSETVRHGTSGYLIPPHDLEGFVNSARKLATDTALRKRMANNARLQAIDTTWERINRQVALRLADALNDVSAKGGAPISKERPLFTGVAYYGSLMSMIRVYFAVGIVWVFWFIAVVPLLLCGWAHGLVR